jgi:hypothetical protein
MVVSAKDTQSAGVVCANPAQLIPYSHWATASVASLQTLHHREQLGRLGRFLARFHKTVRHARSVPGSVRASLDIFFVVLNPELDHWRSINGTFGVARLVSAHRRPMPVPAGVVEALPASVDEVRFDCGLKPGQTVRVVARPFAQFLACCSRLARRDARKF